MKENILLKLALVFSLLGLILLYFLSDVIEPREYNANTERQEIGGFVKAKGIVSKISKKENVVFIEMNQYHPIKIVVFNGESIDLREGDEIEIIGKSEEYKGEKEIIASRIRKTK